MKKCAIIGSNGYIGRHIEWYLKKNGIIPKCYDIQENEAGFDNYEKIDLTDRISVNSIDLDVDYIFFFAGITGTYAGFDFYEKYISINEIGLLNLLDAIRFSQFRPKIVFPSTRLVYKGADKPLTENDDKETKTIYAVNKLTCEGILYAYRASFDIPYTIFRICIPYGNLLGNDYSFGTVGFFIKMASSGKNITLFGGGSIKRTFTYMEDLCYQMVYGAFNEKSNGEIYNIGGETYSLKEVANVIAKKYRTTVIAVPWPDKDLRLESDHTYFDSTKIQGLLGEIKYYTINNLIL
ncbi:NAD(P)-dependent oxidoreductase [uncultured Bacteroides sp.]|uniref:NAD-dependent epimerase/dehydratase family protein n=1 Tax=uncultured Bacteroides sp. TaxID=162156 RepID=UPI002AAA68DF|nr:NAD(P)-dependent oxidoreductase [uncultured Bacteroides sp.]